MNQEQHGDHERAGKYLHHNYRAEICLAVNF